MIKLKLTIINYVKYQDFQLNINATDKKGFQNTEELWDMCNRSYRLTWVYKAQCTTPSLRI